MRRDDLIDTSYPGLYDATPEKDWPQATKAGYCLRRNLLDSPPQVRFCTDDQLLSMTNFGPKLLEIVRRAWGSVPPDTTAAAWQAWMNLSGVIFTPWRPGNYRYNPFDPMWRTHRNW